VTDNFLAEFRRVQAALDDSEEQLRRLDELLMTEPGGNVAARVQDMIDQQRELQQREKRHTAEIRQLRQQIQEAEASRIDPVEFASLRSELRRVDGERTELERQLTEVRGEREDSERECSRLQGRIESLTTASDEDAVLQGVVSVIDRLLARPAKTPPEKEEPVTQSSTEAWTRRGELVLCLCVALGFFVAVFFRALSSTK
jgi:chromosome segregation ATPase